MPSYYGTPRRQKKQPSAKVPGLPTGPRGPYAGSLRERDPGAPRVQRVEVEPEQGPQPGAPPPPTGWLGGPARWAIYWAHGPGRLDRGEPGILWNYRIPLFGSIERLGFVNDFIEYDLGVAIDVVDPRDSGGGTLASIVALRTAILAHVGYRYVLIDADQAIRSPIPVLRSALGGISLSRIAA